MAKQLGVKGLKTGIPIGQHLDESWLQNFRDEQVLQLYELMQETTKAKDFSGEIIEDEEEYPKT